MVHVYCVVDRYRPIFTLIFHDCLTGTDAFDVKVAIAVFCIRVYVKSKTPLLPLYNKIRPWQMIYHRHCFHITQLDIIKILFNYSKNNCKHSNKSLTVSTNYRINTWIWRMLFVKNHLRVSNPSQLMTSSNGNIFGVTGPLCGEFTGHRKIPRTKASYSELWCFIWSAFEYTVE